ncbi:nuclear transport factor 2 family protein [Actinoallomurus acaciae]|uniref:Nuclear transport factor 2 family protein n=1 Tax=Actinoallomurus acaciae TaxID=502577 RepID=A0ABV5YXN8_9ACTN
MLSFRQAIEARDLAAIEPLFAENAVLNSPVAHRPYTGRAIAAAVVRGAARVFEDFHYVQEIIGVDGRDHALVFRATVNGRQVHGCDFLHLDDDGLIDELTVMVRPLSGLNALAEAMGAQFERIKQEAMSA